tara:strand:+ start:684 stop:2036 length:1353 start_codon:yes stop_codon:yes gene_type:complete
MTKRKGVWGINQVRMKEVDDIWVQSTWNYGFGQRGGGQIGEPGCGNPYGVAGRIMTYPEPFDTADSGTKWKKLSSGTDTYTISIWDQDDNMYVYGNNRYAGVLGMNNSNGGSYEGPGAMICSPTLLPAGSGRTWAYAHYADGQCYAVKDNGELWAWGSNEEGALGQNSTSVDMYSSPVQIGTDTTWSSAYGAIKTAGFGRDSRAVYALKTDGTMWVWGRNYQGWLGLNQASTSKSSPTQVGNPGDTAWRNVGDGGRSAIKTDGTLWVWGDGTMGRLGLNQGNGQGGNPGGDYSSPKQIPGTNWHRIYMGTNGSNTVGLKSDGTLWVWGWNNWGALGLNTQGSSAPYYGTQYPGSRSSPTQLGGKSNWVLIGGGTNSYGGRAGNSDGEIWSWGGQSNSSLGLKYYDSTKYSSPVLATGSGTDWKFANSDNTFASTYAGWNGLANKIPSDDL